MAGVAFQIPGGRYRRAEFFVCIPPGINQQLLLDGVRTFKQEVREFCILGNMNMLPTGFFPENHNQHLAIPTDVFYFKKLPHAVNQLRVIPRDLAFLRVVGVQNMPIIGLPLSGKNDFRIRQLEFLCENDYYGLDHGGNEFSLAAWLARAKKKYSAEVITKILDGQITTYKEACNINPLFSFRAYNQIIYALKDVKARHRRDEQMAHVQPFRHLDQTWNHLGGKQRAVFQLITQFHNDKMVRRSTHKRYTGLILWSRANNLGKSSCMNTFCDIGRVYRHIHTDMKWQDTFDAGTEPEHAYCAYFIDELQNLHSVSLSLLEMIGFEDVKIPQRYGKKQSHLPKGTPILITSNNFPNVLFGDHLAMIQERYMIANIDGVPLFPLINYMRTVHGLPQYEAPVEHPVANIN